MYPLYPKTLSKVINNQKGIALVSVVLITLLMMGAFVGIVLMSQTKTHLSGIERSYKIALEASYGIAQQFARHTIEKAIKGTNLSGFNYNITDFLEVSSRTTDECFRTKLSRRGDSTNSTNWGANCTVANLPIPWENPDLHFIVRFPQPQLPYDIFVKIIGATPGNSSRSEVILDVGGVVDEKTTIHNPPHIPFIYTFDVVGQPKIPNNTNPDIVIERSWLNALYAY